MTGDDASCGARTRLAGLRRADDGSEPDRTRLRIGRGADGMERLEASFLGEAFAPHRHDTYAVGVTLSGVQTFRYRGEQRVCLPGEAHILHPDEVHDGAAGTDAGFSYRIIYLDPALVQEAFGGGPLPFVADPVVPAHDVPPGLLACLADLDHAPDDGERVDILLTITALLERLTGSPSRRRYRLDAAAAAARIRDLIAADPVVLHSAAELERASGLNRWELARQFRASFGTSPSRYRTMRQLDQARRLLRTGAPLADAALQAGFADQSHMTRQFKRAYGLTPAAWRAALLAA